MAKSCGTITWPISHSSLPASGQHCRFSIPLPVGKTFGSALRIMGQEILSVERRNPFYTSNKDDASQYVYTSTTERPLEHGGQHGGGSGRVRTRSCPFAIHHHSVLKMSLPLARRGALVGWFTRRCGLRLVYVWRKEGNREKGFFFLSFIFPERGRPEGERNNRKAEK